MDRKEVLDLIEFLDRSLSQVHQAIGFAAPVTTEETNYYATQCQEAYDVCSSMNDAIRAFAGKHNLA